MQDPNSAQQVRDTLNKWLIAFNTKDTKTFFSLYDPESVYANNNTPLMRGVGQIRPWFEQAFEKVTSKLLFLEEVFFQEGNMALIVGKFYFKPLNGNGNNEVGQTGRVTLLYRRTEDGRWLLLYDMDNKAPDAVPQDFIAANLNDELNQLMTVT